MPPRPPPRALERSLTFGQGFEVELIFLNFLCQLNAAKRHGRRLESLESEHRPDPLFYPAMVLLDDVIQVLARAYPHAARQGSGRFQFGDRQMRGAVQGDHPGDFHYSSLPGRAHGASKEARNIRSNPLTSLTWKAADPESSIEGLFKYGLFAVLCG